MSVRLRLLIWPLAFAAFTRPSQALPTSCWQAFRKLTSFDQDVSAEIEIRRTHKVLRALGTSDGTAGAVLRDQDPPAWLVQAAWNASTRAEIFPWHVLEHEQRLALLKFGSQGQDFFKSRTIAGLRMPAKLQVQLTEPTRLMGQVYAPGAHLVNVENVFGEVEHMSPRTVEHVTGFELHLRENLSAGDVSRDAWTLANQSKLSAEVLSMHFHIPREIRRLFPLGSTKVEAFKLADFKRRAEYVAQMNRFMNGQVIGSRTLNVQGTEMVLWKPMLREDLVSLSDWLLRVVNKVPSALNQKDDFKMGYVGLRGPKTYKSNYPMIGLEYRAGRALSGQAKEREEIAQILDAIQATFEDPNYGIYEHQIENWIHKDPERLSYRMGQAYYNAPLTELRAAAPAEIKSLIDQNEATWARFKALCEKNDIYKMLLQDWSRDPLFFDKPSLLNKISLSQMDTLRKVMNEPTSDPSLQMKVFLNRSGLFDNLAFSVGLRRQK